MAYDRIEGPGEAAMLVFAESAKEARKISHGAHWCTSDWIDWVATRMWDVPEHLAALDNGNEQIIEAPPTCPSCDCWGGHLLPGGCDYCTAPSEVPA